MSVLSRRGGAASSARGVDRVCRERGFTLVELLVALAIIAVLIGVLTPVLHGVRVKAREVQTETLMQVMTTAIGQFRAQHNRLPGVFTQEELAREDNLTGFTQMENALLDLAGGVSPQANLSSDTVFDLRIARRTVRVDVSAVGGDKGPGFLPMGVRQTASGDVAANGLGAARVNVQQMQDPNRAVNNKREMPDALDSWGRPVMLWSKNEFWGESPVFARAHTDTTVGNPVKARYYWGSNRGYLASSEQASKSSLGSSMSEHKRVKSLEALLGDPLAPSSATGGSSTTVVPLASRGDYFLHTTGRDALYMSNGGDTTLGYLYSPQSVTIFTQFDPNDRNWRSIAGLDDLLKSSN